MHLVGFIIRNFTRMHGHMDVKVYHVPCSKLTIIQQFSTINNKHHLSLYNDDGEAKAETCSRHFVKRQMTVFNCATVGLNGVYKSFVFAISRSVFSEVWTEI